GVAILAVAWPWGIEAAGATPSPPVRLTLADALDLAARQSPELVSSLQALELSRSRLRESSGSRQPKVILQGSYYGTSAGSPAGALTPGASPSVRVTASQTLPGVLPEPFSVGLSPTELAAIDLDEAERDLAKAKQNVTFNVISAYLNVLKAQQIKSLNDGALEKASSLLDEVRSKLNLGVATQLDLMKAQSQLDQARFNQVKAGDDLDAAMRSLALLLGLPAETKCELVNDFQVEPEERNLEDLVKLALENRVEVKQASLSVLRARAALETAKRSLWPSVGLSATYSNQGDVSVTATGSLDLTSGDVGWTLTLGNEAPGDSPSGAMGAAAAPRSTSASSAGVEISWPLWDGGVARERLGQAETNLEIQESILERQKRTVTEDVYAASVALKQALLRLELAERTVGEAEEALRVTEARFAAGAGVVAEVIDAAHSLASAKTGAVEALFDCYLARARLGKAVGLLGSEGWGQ
ncbi:MAG: TolC family protein, partial [Bacillota bacterium]